MAAAKQFSFPDKGSRVLREWNHARALQRRTQTQMRSSLVGSGGFAGAAVDRLTASLQSWSGSVNADLDNALIILRARARSLCANNEFGRRFLSMVAINVIGSKGPVLQVRAYTEPQQPADSKKIVAPVLDKAANDAIEVHWKRWAKKADIGGRMPLAHLLRVMIKGVARDGEALIRIVRNPKLPYGMALQLLEADRLDESINTQAANGNLIRQGVEIDSALRPLAYYIKARHPGDSYGQFSTNDLERVPASEIYHVYLPERAEQVRGYTWLHAVLIRATRIHSYEEAALVAALVGASKMGIYTREGDQSGPPLAQQLADVKATDGSLQMTAEPGEFVDLTGMPGVKLESWNPDYPHQNFESFLKQCMRGLAAGLDVATHNISGDMTDVNYSSARIAELAERDAWVLLQEWLFGSVLESIFRDWLAAALIKGDITFAQSGKALPAAKLAKFADAARFQGRTWPWVDPVKEVAAQIDAIDAKITSRTRVLAEKGEEYEDVVDEIAQEAEYAGSKGVDLNSPQPAPGAAAPQPPDEEGNTGGKLGKQIAALNKRMEDLAARPPINVDARTTVNHAAAPVTVNLPEQKAAEVKVDVAAPVVHVAPAAVTVQQPKRTVETIERDADHEITRITREAQE